MRNVWDYPDSKSVKNLRGGIYSFRQAIYDSNRLELSNEKLSYLNKLFAGYSQGFSLYSPGTLRSQTLQFS